MLNATRDLTLPSTVTGSWPRPSWFTEVLRGRPFKEALGDSRFREQYMDAVSCIVKEQEMAGLDIVTDGDSRFDLTVGGKSWFFYPIERLLGITGHVDRAAGAGWTTIKPGRILYEVMEAYQPAIAGERLRGGPLQYAALYKVAQRFSARPVKFGSISAQTMTKMITSKHYASDHELVLDAADIINAELREVAAAGCRVIQVEEPRHHIAAADGIPDSELQFLTDALNREIKGVDTEVWLHTCSRAASPAPDHRRRHHPGVCEHGRPRPAAAGEIPHGQEDRHRGSQSLHGRGGAARGGGRSHPTSARVRAARAAHSLQRLRLRA